MKFIFIVILIIISAFIYMKLNPIEPIKNIVIEEATVINKPIIQTKVLPKPKYIQKKVPPKDKPIKQKILPKHKPPRLNKTYHCDRRVYCSQMHSCEEAKFFIRNCRGTKMDGDRDGIPCEKQWCH